MKDFFKEIDAAADAVALDAAFLIVPRKVLLDALKRVSAAVMRRNHQLPVLSNVFFEAGPDGVTLTATNLELRIRVALDGASALFDAMSVCLPYKTLYRAAMHFRGQRIGFFSIHASRAVTIRDGLSTITVAPADAADFPAELITLDMSVRNIVGNPFGFFRDLRAAAKCASDDDRRRALQAVSIETEAGRLRLAATDGKRLIALESSEADAAITPALLPSQYVRAIEAAFSNCVHGNLCMDRFDKFLRFSDGKTTVTVRLIEGQFPNWRQVIPAPEALTGCFEFSAFALLWAIQSATICAPSADRIRLTVKPGRVTLSSVDPDGNSSECSLPLSPEALTLPAGMEEFRVALNWKFLSDACNLGDPVKLRFSDAAHPVIFEAPGAVYCVMPIRDK